MCSFASHWVINGFSVGYYLLLPAFLFALTMSGVRAVWKGRSWARFSLATYCGLAVMVKVQTASLWTELTPGEMIGNSVVAVGYIAAGAVTCCSRSIAELTRFRRQQNSLVSIERHP